MAGLRVAVSLVVLAGTLLLGLVRGWNPTNDTRLLNIYKQWRELQGVTSPVEGDYDYDNEDLVGEDPVPEVEGHATSEVFDFLGERGFEVDAEDSGPRNWARGTESGPPVEFEDSPPRSRSSSISQSSPELDVDVVCSDTSFLITLRSGLSSDVRVLGLKDLLSVMNAPTSCGYEVDTLKNSLTVPFNGCNVKVVTSCNTNSYSLQLLYVDEFGQTKVTTGSCEEKRGKFDPGLFFRSRDQPSSKCPVKPISRPTTALKAPPSNTENCAVTVGERVTCGQPGISSSDCEMMGCCVDSPTSTCFYPLDVCTADQHFVFVIRHNSATIPVDPTKLIIPGSPNCKPVIVNDKVAIFKFKVTECGAHAYEVSETKIYLAEVQTAVQVLNLKYGVITRSDPLRFMFECRYSKSNGTQQSLASAAYMVKIPASGLQSEVLGNGLYGVQLRIATDKTYSSYLPTTSQPLRLLLGNPVYLELHLKSPKPDAVILVNYCIAYPRSAKNALVLVYEGCANPYDPSVSILQVSDLPTNRHQRRFVVKAFQFMDLKMKRYLNEEIYFMCSSEVCRPAEKTCEERCFDGKV